MKRNSRFYLCILLLPLLLSSCYSYRNVPYLTDSDQLAALPQDPALYDARIMPKDLLSIVVSSTEPELAAPFNLTTPGSNTATSTLQQFLVDNAGMINFPVLGMLSVGGLTKSEAEQLLVKKLEPYLKDNVIVTVRMANYKITVLGEVASPGTFVIANEKVNVLEALAMAGDMTVYGLRENVKLVREDEKGVKQIVGLNLNDSRIILSPYYDLQQNDILYVTPNKTKSKNSDIGSSTMMWFTSISMILSVATFVSSILR